MKILKEKGITLLALVVTIIILLILAGVTLNLALSNEGIFSRAKKATESYKVASEKEYLEQNIISVSLGKFMEDVSSEKLGEELNTRNLNNTTNWHIIKVNDNSYETGWNFLEKGTEIQDYGKVQNSWLINYETGELIQLEDDSYISLSAGDMLAVKDSLIINVDSSIVDKDVENNKETLEKQLGDNVELVNFNYNDESGLTSTSFNFDGVDDYIKIKYDDSPALKLDGTPYTDKEGNNLTKKQVLAQNGFTFEFYGTYNGGTSYYNNQEVQNTAKGLFCYGRR